MNLLLRELDSAASSRLLRSVCSSCRICRNTARISSMSCLQIGKSVPSRDNELAPAGTGLCRFQSLAEKRLLFLPHLQKHGPDFIHELPAVYFLLVLRDGSFPMRL